MRIVEHLSKLGAPPATRNVIVPGFGMTEICVGGIFNKECPDLDLNSGTELAALGKYIPGLEMRISNAESQDDDTDDTERKKALTSVSGELELRCPIVFERYYNDDIATQGPSRLMDGSKRAIWV